MRAQEIARRISETFIVHTGERSTFAATRGQHEDRTLPGAQLFECIVIQPFLAATREDFNIVEPDDTRSSADLSGRPLVDEICEGLCVPRGEEPRFTHYGTRRLH